MNRRESPDGLPFRVYQRFGKKIYSIGYKSPDGIWTFRLKCNVDDDIAVHKLRGEALRRHASLMDPQAGDDSFAAMSKAFFIRQASFPLNSPERRAESTLSENQREARNLEKAFGKMNINHFKAMHAYQYLDACEAAGRGPKGNKEISLATLMFENYVRVGKLTTNPSENC
jgi:hypothetical protein